MELQKKDAYYYEYFYEILDYEYLMAAVKSQGYFKDIESYTGWTVGFII